jgi:hypothetical protein
MHTSAASCFKMNSDRKAVHFALTHGCSTPLMMSDNDFPNEDTKMAAIIQGVNAFLTPTSRDCCSSTTESPHLRKKALPSSPPMLIQALSCKKPKTASEAAAAFREQSSTTSAAAARVCVPPPRVFDWDEKVPLALPNSGSLGFSLAPRPSFRTLRATRHDQRRPSFETFTVGSFSSLHLRSSSTTTSSTAAPATTAAPSPNAASSSTSASAASHELLYPLCPQMPQLDSSCALEAAALEHRPAPQRPNLSWRRTTSSQAQRLFGDCGF